VSEEASSPSRAGAPGATNAIVAVAEAAAGEIRASAEREAQLIRATAGGGPIGSIRALRDTIARQRETLAGLAAETTRVEHSAAILQAQVRALEAEMHSTHGRRRARRARELTLSTEPRLGIHARARGRAGHER